MTKAAIARNWIERFPVLARHLSYNRVIEAIYIEYGVEVSYMTVCRAFHELGYKRLGIQCRIIHGQMYWSLSALSDQCGYSIANLWGLVYQKRIPAKFIDGKWYATKDAVQHYIQER